MEGMQCARRLSCTDCSKSCFAYHPVFNLCARQLIVPETETTTVTSRHAENADNAKRRQEQSISSPIPTRYPKRCCVYESIDIADLASICQSWRIQQDPLAKLSSRPRDTSSCATPYEPVEGFSLSILSALPHARLLKAELRHNTEVAPTCLVEPWPL
ncbi:hypothetical protein K402DRAFT_139824 [Aulographum hederae CBS 113979]|uniref:Uncharacterized protein n=1 Tax=Aulographum hederae CBS 113979 TaxID=1176131 RepID=A0A6G1GUY7_9PEZI|nr:hypothetical protein K402DRAFT_139824 [Aulographum hederae CBS 113979]